MWIWVVRAAQLGLIAIIGVFTAKTVSQEDQIIKDLTPVAILGLAIAAGAVVGELVKKEARKS